MGFRILGLKLPSFFRNVSAYKFSLAVFKQMTSNPKLSALSILNPKPFWVHSRRLPKGRRRRKTDLLKTEHWMVVKVYHDCCKKY